mgnify:CR=1 FL=1
MLHEKILVSGGAGFIGSHLCTRLIKDGHEVICLDNLFTGSEENIAHLKGNPRFQFVLHDVELPYEAEVDEIYNLACPASPVHYQHDAIKTIKTSVLGAINMLGLAKKNGCKNHAGVYQRNLRRSCHTSPKWKVIGEM